MTEQQQTLDSSGVRYFIGAVVMAMFLTLGVYAFKANVLNKRRRRGGYLTNRQPMMVPVEVSNEANTLNNMQVTGYENPTYKYFELQT
jgi:hypothetical protein